jgi:tetratricopeptide (TPR) repeat protein
MPRKARKQVHGEATSKGRVSQPASGTAPVHAGGPSRSNPPAFTAPIPLPVFKPLEDFAAIRRGHLRQIILVCLVLLAVTFLVYGRVGSYGFADQDDSIVSNNSHVKDGFAPGSIGWAFTETKTIGWQPLTWLSHMLDSQLFGLSPGRHHLVSVGLHGVNAALVFLMLLYATGSLWRCALAAALFALHPLRVESVVSVAERRDVLNGLFWIVTLWLYAWYARRPESRKRYVSVFLALWLALSSGPMAVTLPAVMLLLDCWPLGRLRKETAHRLVIEKIPLFLSAASAWAITMVSNSPQATPFRELALNLRIVHACAAYAAYLGKLVWPASLSAFYLPVGSTLAGVAMAGFVFVFLSAAAARTVRSWPWILTGWLWFLITLLPAIGLVRFGEPVFADRFTYVSLIGPTIALVWLVSHWLESQPRLRPAFVAGAAVALVALSGLSWRQSGYWADNFSIDRHAVAVSGNDPAMLFAFGNKLARAGRWDEAVQNYREVVRLEPANFDARKSLGMALLQAGVYEEAIDPLQIASRANPNDAVVKQLLQMAMAAHPSKAAAPAAHLEPRPEAQAEHSPSESEWLTPDRSLEAGCVLAIIAIALWWPEFGKRAFIGLERLLTRLAQRPVRAMVLAALLPMMVRLLLLPIYPIPEPVIADEFGYLLLGNTFASGRLANPPHPMGGHFESNYILQNPTYTSYFPIGQGLCLAAALALGINPWWGVWLSVGLMCAALHWMLSGWMPPRWALLGAFLAGMRLSVLSHWMNSFWGGAAPAIGGALVLGALPRIFRAQRPLDAVLMGLGLAILGQTRPYEGLLFSVPVAIVLLNWLLRTKTAGARVRFTAVVLPLTAVLLCFAAFTAYYNRRVTGNPLQLPYQRYQKLYGVPQAFYWQRAYPPAKSERLSELAENYEAQLENYNEGRSWAGLARASGVKLRGVWRFYLQPAWTMPILALPWLWRNRRLRFLAATCVCVIAALAMYHSFLPHYFAPASAGLLALVVAGIRRMRLWQWRNRPLGAALAAGVAAVSALGLAISPAGAEMMGPGLVHSDTPRARVLKSLRDRGGKHLVIVRYGPQHSHHFGVINNEANIDSSLVVWARDLGAQKNGELVQYFHDRAVWEWDPDQFPVHLLPYAAPASPAL